MADLALLLELGELAELLLARHLRVDAVQLVEVDRVDPEAAQAQLALLAQVLGPADGRPFAGALAGVAALGGDATPSA